MNTRTASTSIARMQSPAGWEEPGQKPEFDEFTVVLKGMLRVKTATQKLWMFAQVRPLLSHRGEWVQYSSPEAGGAEYIAVCLPAFSPDTVHRELMKRAYPGMSQGGGGYGKRGWFWYLAFW